MELVREFLAGVNWRDIIFSGVRILFTLIVVWFLVRILSTVLNRLERLLVRQGLDAGEVPTEATKRVETIGRLLRQAVIIAVWIVGILIILNECGVKIMPIIASLGVAGLALGFGAQNLVRDVISGFFFILENQVRVGDSVIVNGTGGLVESLNLRTLVLRDGAGVVHIFPNGTITTLSNSTKGWSAHVFKVGVAYHEDTDHVIEIIRRVGQEMKADPRLGALMIADLEVHGVEDLADSAVVVQGRIRTLPGRNADVAREFRRRVKKTFDAEGIEIPCPQVSVSFSEASRPLQAQITGLTTNATEKETS